MSCFVEICKILKCDKNKKELSLNINVDCSSEPGSRKRSTTLDAYNFMIGGRRGTIQILWDIMFISIVYSSLVQCE